MLRVHAYSATPTPPRKKVFFKSDTSIRMFIFKSTNIEASRLKMLGTSELHLAILLLFVFIAIISAAPVAVITLPYVAPPIYTNPSPDTGGPGIHLLNADPLRALYFYFYNEDTPSSACLYVYIPPSTQFFISTANMNLTGHFRRGDWNNHEGTANPYGTRVMIATDTVGMRGRVSLLYGCDGSATVTTLGDEGLESRHGFAQDIIPGAPNNYVQKASGQWILAPTYGNYATAATMEYETAVVGLENAWIRYDQVEQNWVRSLAYRLQITFFPGIV